MIFIVPFHIDIHLLWLYGLPLLVGGGGDMLEEGASPFLSHKSQYSCTRAELLGSQSLVG